MELAEKYSRSLPEDLRKAGEALAVNAVRRWGGDDRICCDFPEDGGYECHIQLDGRFPVSSCQCEAFEKAGACPHIWAAILVADDYSDLRKALQRNVPARIKACEKSEESHLEYEKKGRAGHRITSEKDGMIYDYGIFHKKKMPSAPVVKYTASTEKLDFEMVYVLRADLHEAHSANVTIDVRWRGISKNGDKPMPSRPFLPESDGIVPSREDAELLRYMSQWHRTNDAANRFYVSFSDDLAELLGNCKVLRWAEKTEKGIALHEMHVSDMFAMEARIACDMLPSGAVKIHAGLHDINEYIDMQNARMLIKPMKSGAKGYALAENTLMPVFFMGAEDIFEEMFVGREAPIFDYSTALGFVKKLARESDLDISQLPMELAFQSVKGEPVGELYVRTAKFKYKDHEQLHAELSFNYDGVICHPGEMGRLVNGRCVIERDELAEERLAGRLGELGFRYNEKAYLEELGWKLHPSQLDCVVRVLVDEGWMVTAEGRTYRKPVVKQPSVKSGIDWFEVDGGADYAGMNVALPELLSAMRNGQKSVRLDDGTYGLLPVEWLANFTVLTELGNVEDGRLCFRMEQAAMVASVLEQRAEEATGHYGEYLRTLENLSETEAVSAPAGFKATLRPYQAIGLGWLLKMQKAGLGACLADDMGLGKTIQVLAVLAGRAEAADHLPSLVVVPRSLIFNWEAEAAKFAPGLRRLVHSGSSRRIDAKHFAKYDIVFTTYGTLRNDALRLSEIQFDYCVLDESQAIKNYESSTAKAARCIKAKYRIAMTGTPIENSLSELFSQLDFLNPGLFGRGGICSARISGNDSENGLVKIRNGVRAFVLRRTKAAVAKELPPKTEQVLMCEMPPEDQAEYDELLEYYRKKIAEDESGGMLVLAALTKLRQAACHPGLLKMEKLAVTSAKLEMLVAQLETVVSSGHKALVFSQFTSFLKIIQNRLDECGYGMCYLDGTVKDRAAVVDEFQNNPEKSVFLISLKAGGVGLNLTAADYVYIMDPWWNPAAESQAVDRAYRIGQKNPVMAYRMVTRNTIEEKVMKLKEGKSKLASAVIDDEAGLPASLSIKDLEGLINA